jgi:hypothetical protein
MSLIQETVKATGALNVTLTGPDGVVKESVFIPNLVVTVGKNFIAARLKTTGIPTEPTYMGVGNKSLAQGGGADPAAGDTQLGGELARVTLTTSGGTVSSNVVTYNATFNPTVGTGAIVEAGIFAGTASATANSGTLLCRTTFAVVNKGNDDTLAITWTVTIS